MRHLPTDRLAALADEAPGPDEAAHLAICAECAREVRAYQALLTMAHAESDTSGVARLEMPLTRWDSIAAALREERATAAPVVDITPARAPRRFTMPAWATRAAAAVLLVAGGVVAGRVSAPVRVAANDPPPVKLPKLDTKPAPTKPEIISTPVAKPSEARLASNVPLDSLIPTTFASVDEARLWQQRFENAYQNAAAFIAANDTVGRGGELSPDDRAYRTRLAALDRAGRVMRDALRDAPEDPVINGYYLTTLGQREATLRQINVSQPGGQRVIGF